MSCCDTGLAVAGIAAQSDAIGEEVRLASRDVGGGLRQTDLSVPGVHCGACIATIERELLRLPGVEHARVNLSTKRVTIRWRGDGPVPAFIETLKGTGFDAHLFDVESSRGDPVFSELIKALAVSGFASSNIMLLSVSIWSGADAESRDLFHLLSALIALPALAYSGRVFFRSAWRSLRHGRTNMDVPISIGVLLAFALSLYETIVRGPHAYFDAAISLLFFLLIGRTLDHMMRERARSAVTGLARLAARVARLAGEDGRHTFIPVAEVRPGMLLLVAAGDRVPVDATVKQGASDIDISIISGESAPQAAEVGSVLRAGSLNLTGPLTVVANASARNSFLAEMVRLMEAAEQGRSTYRRIADRAAAMYAPVVHLTALVAFVGWLFATGDFHRAITIAIAVLIITCPCALGLAVPMVQVVASRRLFEAGVMVKDGGALEKLAEIDTVLLDKTGTLTAGDPQLVVRTGDQQALSIAATLASRSSHPYSRAIAQTVSSDGAPLLEGIIERPGLGLEARLGADMIKLGRSSWASQQNAAEESSVVLSRAGRIIAAFDFHDRMRQGAEEAVAALTSEGLDVEIVSGDNEARVQRLGGLLGIQATAELMPSDKVARIIKLRAAGHKVLMVGDGLNDAPALAAAHASIAPSSAADVGRQAADVVFLKESLIAVPLAVRIARRAKRLVHENLMLAVAYNVIAVPVAVAGYVTPLVAAVAMSGSSILVVLNALRLSGLAGGTSLKKETVQIARFVEAAE
ncbi:Cu2+-exporting ATPase [Afipia massiliensis]|uniref:Cu2+-exporting ATPase n=1 Tax=Afipia massiliensis TaxID=211460 RepID=A0A840MW69_9BRAD|nr:heavy metal translocating P-type ATPase [Afipia massiliensis]MBB5050952.1 Cu2+-exporting ATPase [Afipia massiliensis]